MYKEEELKNHLKWDPASKFLLVVNGLVHGYDSLSDAYVDASDYVESWGEDTCIVIVDTENASQTVFCPGASA